MGDGARWVRNHSNGPAPPTPFHLGDCRGRRGHYSRNRIPRRAIPEKATNGLAALAFDAWSSAPQPWRGLSLKLLPPLWDPHPAGGIFLREVRRILRGLFWRPEPAV